MFCDSIHLFATNLSRHQRHSRSCAGFLLTRSLFLFFCLVMVFRRRRQTSSDAWKGSGAGRRSAPATGIFIRAPRDERVEAVLESGGRNAPATIPKWILTSGRSERHPTRCCRLLERRATRPGLPLTSPGRERTRGRRAENQGRSEAINDASQPRSSDRGLRHVGRSEAGANVGARAHANNVLRWPAKVGFHRTLSTPAAQL
jgi:hypothetical protein